MPRLSTLLPCEKVLFGDNQTVSLIVILSEFHFIPQSEEALRNIPPNSATPFRWSIFVQWEREPEDADNQEFEQSLAMTSESGQIFFTNITKFSFRPNDRIHRQLGNSDIIPILPAGRYELIARWRRDENSTWIDAARYPIWVVYDPVPIQRPVAASTT